MVSSKTQNYLLTYPFPVLSPEILIFNLFVMINTMILLVAVMINKKHDRKNVFFIQVYLHYKKFSEGKMTPKLFYVKLVIIG